MTNKIFWVIALLVTLTLPTVAQTNATPTKPAVMPPNLPPGNIQLLDGYQHTGKRGIDSRVGEIGKPGEMIIHYDIGRMAGLYASRECAEAKDCLLYKKQNINESEVFIGLTREGKIYATFPGDYANFYAETKSSEDITDFLLMILTYKVKEASAK